MDREQQKNYQTVCLAGLLHDIGKFLQRAAEKTALEFNDRHPYFSAKFIEDNYQIFEKTFDVVLLKSLVQKHHEGEKWQEEFRAQYKKDSPELNLSLLISQSDNFSASERETDHKRTDFRVKPLARIFSKIKLPESAEKPRLSFHCLSPYEAGKALDEIKGSQLKPDEYERLYDQFKKDLETLTNAKLQNPDSIYSAIFSLLLKYTWCIPSDTQMEAPDISLFDHLKTTSAIASCLYRYHESKNETTCLTYENIKDEKTPKFVLLMGDLSGIQDYIFSLAKVGAGAISKRLRARSFKLALLSYWVSNKILSKFNLPYANLISASGGNFVILLPNLPGIDKELGTIQEELDRQLMEDYSGEIALHLVWEPFSGSQFSQREFPKVLAEVHRKLAIKKKGPFQKYLIKDGCWKEENFKLKRPIESEEKVCVICKKHPGNPDPGDDNQIVCDSCKKDRELGTKLVNAKGVAFYAENKKPTEDAFPILDGFFVPLTEISKAPGEPLIILSFEPVCLETKIKSPAFPMLMANHIPKGKFPDICNECEIKDECEDKKNMSGFSPLLFECIAQKAKGRKYLAMLKADVDKLGELFSKGLKDKGSISRYTTFSRMLDLFFCGWIQEKIQEKIEKEYHFLYVVYSGGDDLMIIGPWDKIFEFSKELRNEFARFTGSNPDFHFSASIILGTPHTPVNFIARKAQEMLELAKHKDDEKDKLSALGDLVKWDKVRFALDEARKLADWINNDKVSVSFARNLLYYANLYDQYNQKRISDYLRFVPLLTYDIARNLPSMEDEDPEKREARKWAEDLKNQAMEQKGELLDRLKFIASYAILTSFGKKEIHNQQKGE